MKIRTDFVTNSSSVSYIVTMDLNIVNCFIDLCNGIEGNEDRIRIAKALRDFMTENGNVVYLHDHEIYTYLMEFRDDDGSCTNKKILEENSENTDPLKMNEEDLFKYVKGEYIQQQKLSGFLNGFGATQVEQY